MENENMPLNEGHTPEDVSRLYFIVAVGALLFLLIIIFWQSQQIADVYDDMTLGMINSSYIQKSDKREDATIQKNLANIEIPSMDDDLKSIDQDINSSL